MTLTIAIHQLYVGFAYLIHCLIEIGPLVANFQIYLVEAPRWAGSRVNAVSARDKRWSLAPYPAHERLVGQQQALRGHGLHKVA